ncbi:MAG: hypothetical protein ACRC8Y_27145 [Chroococcales cyanobacterium]
MEGAPWRIHFQLLSDILPDCRECRGNLGLNPYSCVNESVVRYPDSGNNRTDRRVLLLL